MDLSLIHISVPITLALKQVPSCEFFPMEAVKTNVIGTDNVLTAAIEAGVGAVICLSTDVYKRQVQK